MNLDELITVGAQALYGEGEEGPSLEAEQRREGCRTLAEEIIDAVTPYIEQIALNAQRAELRAVMADVKALRVKARIGYSEATWVRIDHVTDLLHRRLQ